MSATTTTTRAACIECGAEMVEGLLRDALAIIHIEVCGSPETSDLRALVCLRCGHVKLQAAEPGLLSEVTPRGEEPQEGGRLASKIWSYARAALPGSQTKGRHGQE